jgi:hypothetical protein
MIYFVEMFDGNKYKVESGHWMDMLGFKTSHQATFVFDTYYKQILKDRFFMPFDKFLEKLHSFDKVPFVTKDQLDILYADV